MSALPGAVVIAAALASGPRNPDPHFPAYHVRPPAGHVNDPNGEQRLKIPQKYLGPVDRPHPHFNEWPRVAN